MEYLQYRLSRMRFQQTHSRMPCLRSESNSGGIPPRLAKLADFSRAVPNYPCSSDSAFFASLKLGLIFNARSSCWRAWSSRCAF